MSDRLFRLHTVDPPPPARRSQPAHPPPPTVQIGEENVYEVEAIRSKRLRQGNKVKRVEYEIKWQGWPETANTWETASQINKALVKAYETGAAAQAAQPARSRQPAPPLPHRGQGAARAHISGAEQRRGGRPTCISMVCGAVSVKFKQPLLDATMPTLALTFKVLSMDSTGHITWPTTFSATTQAALRLQARALLRKMMDDPLNPVDETMAPALTGTGTSSVWQGPPMRRLLVAQPGAQ